jgi:hypothetical protein
VKQEGNANEHLINYKQIIPSKTELSNVELETIHNSMRTGGVIAIKNCLLVQDSLIKLLDEFQDKNVVINENFKLILLVKTNNLLPKYLYTSTNIIHNDFILLKIMKEYIINLIKETPIDYYNKFMNYDLHTNIMFHLKKIFIYFIIINAVLVQYSILNSKMYKIPIDFCKKDFIISLKFIDQYISSINEEKMKALLDPDNSYGFNFDSIIKLSLDNFVNARLIYREDEESVQKMLSQFFEGEQFLRENNNYFNHNGFLVPKLNEKLFPKKKELTPRDEHITVRHSNKSISSVSINYYIPKDAVIDLFEKIPDEKYYYLLYGVSNDMIYTQTKRIIYDFYNIFSKNSTDETFDLKKTKIISYDLPEIFNIKSEIVQLLEDIKKSLPDQLNTADANPILFKVNKFNELFNPLDRCLEKEIEFFNMYINIIIEDINNILLILQGDMMLNDKYCTMINSLSKNLVPKEWKKTRLYPDLSVEKWLNLLKSFYSLINNWIIDGSLFVYDLSALYNTKLFLITLPIYFQKKLQENNTVSSDKIHIEYKLTKYEKIEEINDTIIEQLKKQNGNKDILLIKGLTIKNFDSFYEKDTKVFEENKNKKGLEELPIVLVTYSIGSSEDNIKDIRLEEEENNDDEEEEETISKNLNARKSLANVEKSISKLASESQVKELDEEEYDQVPDDLSPLSSSRISKKFVHSKSVYYKDKSSKKTSVNIMQKYKYFSLKRYCKLHVPIIDINRDEVYGLDEPLGFIELKIKCTNDKQDAYFINSKINIDIDNKC